MKREITIACTGAADPVGIKWSIASGGPVIAIRSAAVSTYQMSNAGRLLLGALCLAALGGIAFVVGIGAAFGRAGNWSNTLAGFGVLLLIGSGILAIATVTAGVANSIHARKFNWWLPLACVTAGLALWGGWVAINL